jgi:serine/threonine-protein kinase
MPIQPGVKLGAYEVEEYLGRGAMGVVFRVYHPGLARAGAAKVLQALAPDPDAAARFRREAQAIAQMRHPNILNVFDFGEYEGVPYMIVEFVPGGSLADRLRRGPRLGDDATLKTLRGLAAALDYAHGLGVVHRDVKPANVLLGKDENPILADFGLAKLLQSASVKTMSGVTTGTPAYMAPEQVVGGVIGPAADRYALATIAYELLAGRVPFEGDSVLELMYAHVHRVPAPVSSHRGDLGPKVDAVLARGLLKEPDKRWESCGAMVDALEAALHERTESERTAVLAVPVRRPRFAPVLAAVAAALIVALVLAGVALATIRNRDQAQLTGGVSASVVRPGQTVVVSAQGLPANQSGVIRFASPVRDLSQFHADAQGEVSQDVRVPVDTGTGERQVQLCWSGKCHDLVQVTVTRAG